MRGKDILAISGAWVVVVMLLVLVLAPAIIVYSYHIGALSFEWSVLFMLLITSYVGAL